MPPCSPACIHFPIPSASICKSSSSFSLARRRFHAGLVAISSPITRAAPLPRRLGRYQLPDHSRTAGLAPGISQFEIPVCVRRTGRRNSKLRPALRLPCSPAIMRSSIVGKQDLHRGRRRLGAAVPLTREHVGQDRARHLDLGRAVQEARRMLGRKPDRQLVEAEVPPDILQQDLEGRAALDGLEGGALFHTNIALARGGRRQGSASSAYGTTGGGDASAGGKTSWPHPRIPRGRRWAVRGTGATPRRSPTPRA